MTMTHLATKPAPTTNRLRQVNAANTWLLTFGLRFRERCLWWTQLLQFALMAAAVAGVFVLAGGRGDGLRPIESGTIRPLAAAAIMLFGGAVIAYVVELEARLTERRRAGRAGDRVADSLASGLPAAMSEHERQIVLAALARHRAMPINTIAEDDVLEVRCAELLHALDSDTVTGVDTVVLDEYARRYARPYPALPQLPRAR